MSDEQSPQLVTLLAVALLLIASGCVASDAAPNSGTATASPTTTPAASSADASSETTGTVAGPLQPPDRPDELTPESVAAFVNRSEYVRTYNRSYEGMTRIDIACEARHTERTPAGFYLIAACGGSASNAEMVADFGPTPVPYFVDETTTIRVGDLDARSRSVTETYAAADPEENVNPPNQSAAGFRVYNFADRTHDLSVDVTYLNASRPERVLSTAYELRPRRGVRQERVTVRRGTYRIEARLDDGATATYRWTVDGSLGYSWAETAIYVTPDGELFVVELPIHELHTAR